MGSNSLWFLQKWTCLAIRKDTSFFFYAFVFFLSKTPGREERLKVNIDAERRAHRLPPLTQHARPHLVTSKPTCQHSLPWRTAFVYLLFTASDGEVIAGTTQPEGNSVKAMTAQGLYNLSVNVVPDHIIMHQYVYCPILPKSFWIVSYAFLIIFLAFPHSVVID